MGCLFLLFQGVGILLGAKKLGTALLDLVFCCLCGGFVFLCALAVDSGRLRLYQAALQGLGAWAAAASLGPWAAKGGKPGDRGESGRGIKRENERDKISEIK